MVIWTDQIFYRGGDLINKCTIVMYHFVRELQLTRYPQIKARLLSEFKNQINYLENNYQFVRVENLLEVIYGNEELPENAVLLTFDDGYKDHFDNVFPILDKKNIQGCFFPPAKALLNNEVLDVNKIHCILAVNEEKDNIKGLVEDIFNLLDDYRHEYNLKSNEEYYTDLAKESRFDTKDVIFIKRLLQRELKDEIRKKILDTLFEKYVGIKESVFANELYMSLEQLKCMIRNGMHIGSHGYKHYWLDSISQEKIEKEINSSIDFLNKLGINKELWTFCYPYGAYNKHIRETLSKKGFKLGFTTEVKVADLDKVNAMELPRLDTNDIPF